MRLNGGVQRQASIQKVLENILQLEAWAQWMAGHNGNLVPRELCPQLGPAFARDHVCPNHIFCVTISEG